MQIGGGMSIATKTLCSLMTLDLRYADSYRTGFYDFLEYEDWKKRDEADTAWTQLLTVPDDSGYIIAESLSKSFSLRFIKFLNTMWEDNYGVLPNIIKVNGIIQIGDEGYFSIKFIMDKKENVERVIVKYLSY